jgi:hypothetical protein
MKIHGAVVIEQGVTFAIIVVKRSAMNADGVARETRAIFQGLFPGLPMVLASQDEYGDFEYQGREDLVSFLVSIQAWRIPWMEYTVE